ATAEISAKMCRIAAHLLGGPAEGFEVAAGVARRRDDPGVALTLAEVATAAILGHQLPPGDDPGLEATAYFDPPASAFGYGAVAARVEVIRARARSSCRATSWSTTAAPRWNP